MAGLMDMISSRDSSLDKSIAETTMQCLKEMKKQTEENVELVKTINTLVEASINKIKTIEAKQAQNELDPTLINDMKTQVIEELQKELSEIKIQFSDELTIIKSQLSEENTKENAKFFKNLKSILEDYDESQERKFRSIGRYLKGIIWFLFLITALMITNILGII